KHGVTKGSSVVSHVNLESQKIEPELITWSQIRVPKEWTLSKKFIQQNQPKLQNATAVDESKNDVKLSFRSNS
ncbi:hypothetical protein KI387_032793, partial [Taxus chinensis]